MAERRPLAVTSEEQYVEFVHARASALLRTACLLSAGDRASAEDLVHRALVRAYAKRRRVRTPTETEADAKRSLVRLAVRAQRDGGWHSAGAAAGPDTSRLTILDALRALPAKQRAVVVLRYYNDYSEGQIADALGSAAGTVRRLGSRALETLREQRTEEQLRSSLETAADPIRADADLIGRVIEESRWARRQRRRTSWLTACVATVTALVGAGLVVLDESDDDSLPEPDPPQLIEVDPVRWARQLPQGAPIRLPYTVGNDLHFPGQRTNLPGEVRDVIGKTSAGWLVAVDGWTVPHKGGLPAMTHDYGLVTSEGTLQRLPRGPYHGSPGVRALSPDGELLAMGGVLVDVATGRVVGRIPQSAFSASIWTPVGLIYQSRSSGSSWLWQPGSPPIPLAAYVWATATTAPVVLTASRDGCTNVAHLRADGGIVTANGGCLTGASTPIWLSPSGAYAVTADLGVLNVNDGMVTPFELPSSGIAGPEQIGWEDDDHFVLPVESRDTRSRDRVVFVRCSVAMHSCERAGPEFTKPITTEVLVSFLR
jgi:RNA polymerase sigma factor (sigma-70 family)